MTYFVIYIKKRRKTHSDQGQLDLRPLIEDITREETVSPRSLPLFQVSFRGQLSIRDHLVRLSIPPGGNQQQQRTSSMETSSSCLFFVSLPVDPFHSAVWPLSSPEVECIMIYMVIKWTGLPIDANRNLTTHWFRVSLSSLCLALWLWHYPWSSIQTTGHGWVMIIAKNWRDMEQMAILPVIYEK